MDRRVFVARAVASGAALWVGTRAHPLSAARAPQLHVQLLVSSEETPAAISARRGAELAGSEAGRAAALLRREFRLTVGDAAAEEAQAVVRATSAAARSEDGARLVLDLVDGTCAAALRLQPPPHVIAAARERAGGGDIVRWHGSLTRYGAAQLNDRYRAAHGDDMDDMAWAAWFAVKMLWDSAARVHDVTAQSLRTFLLSERGVFDGHKGEPLRFTSDGLLLQPLYALRTGAAPEAIAMNDLISDDVRCER